MKKFLITRPEHDDTTYYLSNWSKKIIEVANSKGIKLFDLHREKAKRAEVTSIIEKQSPGLIVFNGHGDDNCVTGHKQEVLVEAGKNESLLKERITYAVSCRSAKLLGPKSVAAGAKAYIGYDDDFVFIYSPEKITQPLNDETAKLFLEPSNELIISLIKGNTTEESHKRSQEFFKDRMKKVLSSESTSEETSMVRYLWWDMVHQVCLGDQKAVFNDE